MKTNWPAWALAGIVVFGGIAANGGMQLRDDGGLITRRAYVDSMNADVEATHVDGDPDTGVYWWCQDTGCYVLGIAVAPEDDVTVQEVIGDIDSSPDFVATLAGKGFKKVRLNVKGEICEFKLLAPHEPKTPPKGEPAWWQRQVTA